MPVIILSYVQAVVSGVSIATLRLPVLPGPLEDMSHKRLTVNSIPLRVSKRTVWIQVQNLTAYLKDTVGL